MAFTIGARASDGNRVRSVSGAAHFQARPRLDAQGGQRPLRHRRASQAGRVRRWSSRRWRWRWCCWSGAALLIRTFVGLRSVESGLRRAERAHVPDVAGGLVVFDARQAVANLTTQVVRRVEAVPGVEAAASTVVLPVEAGIDLPFTIRRQAADAGRPVQRRRAVAVDLAALLPTCSRFRCCAGACSRTATPANAARVVVINEAMAKKYWPKEDPIGQVIVIGKGLGPQFEEPPRQIVGIVGNVRESGLQNANVGVMYVPQSQMTEGLTALANNVLPLSWAVARPRDPMSMRVAIEREVRAVDGHDAGVAAADDGAGAVGGASRGRTSTWCC